MCEQLENSASGVGMLCVPLHLLAVWEDSNACRLRAKAITVDLQPRMWQQGESSESEVRMLCILASARRSLAWRSMKTSA